MYLADAKRKKESAGKVAAGHVAFIRYQGSLGEEKGGQITNISLDFMIKYGMINMLSEC